MISVKGDVKDLTRYLTRLEKKQVPFATALALTKTAQHISGSRGTKGVLSRTVSRVFDRPVRRTVDAFFTIPANKRARLLEASVNFKGETGGRMQGTPPFKYLKTQITSGFRRATAFELILRRLGVLKSSEFVVPGDSLKLNRYGNIPLRVIKAVISDIRSGKASSGGSGYFYDKDITEDRGIYKRTGRRKKVNLALYFVRQPRYTKRFDFAGISARSAKKRFPIEFKRAMERALATAR